MTNEPNPHQRSTAQAGHEPASAPEQKPIAPRLALTALVIVLLVFAALGISGILSRKHSDRVLADSTNAAAAPTVIALPAKPGAPADSFVLPGNVTAYTDSPVYPPAPPRFVQLVFDLFGRGVKK